jgi:hypothetical protein
MAGDKIGVIRSQEEDRPDNISGLTQPSERSSINESLLEFPG